MFTCAADREIAEEDSKEYWQELQADDEALRLYYEAQVNAIELEAELDALREMEDAAVF